MNDLVQILLPANAQEYDLYQKVAKPLGKRFNPLVAYDSYCKQRLGSLTYEEFLDLALQHQWARRAALEYYIEEANSRVAQDIALSKSGKLLLSATETLEVALEAFQRQLAEGAEIRGRDIERLTTALKNVKEAVGAATPESNILDPQQIFDIPPIEEVVSLEMDANAEAEDGSAKPGD